MKTFLPCLLALSCCVTGDDTLSDPELDTTEQGVGTSIGVGDFNNDLATNAADSAAYLRSLGLQFDTYQVTDDVYNPAIGQPRDKTNVIIKQVSGACLASRGLFREAYPLERIPRIDQLARSFSKLPQHYLRAMAARGVKIVIAGDLGKVAKRWQFTNSEFAGYEISLHKTTATTWAGSYRVKYGDPWLPLSKVSADEGNGVASFLFPPNKLMFRGTIDPAIGSDGISPAGTAMDAVFYDPSSSKPLIRSWDYSLRASYAAGGSVRFNEGTAGTCVESDDYVGQSGPFLFIGVGGVGTNVPTHEIGHVVDYFLIREQRTSFTSSDDMRRASTFPELGWGTDLTDGVTEAQLKGSGFVSVYASGNGHEDFAETFEFYFNQRSKLETRISEDLALVGNTALTAKRDFIANVVDAPDPGAAVAVHPATGVTWRFSTHTNVRYVTSTNAINGTSMQSRYAPAVASNNVDKLWLFAISEANIPTYRSIDAAGTFSSVRSLTGIQSRLPVAPIMLRAGVLAVFYVGFDNQIGSVLVDANTGAVLGTIALPIAKTAQPIAVATLDGRTWVWGLDDPGYLMLLVIDNATFGTKPVASSWTSTGLSGHAVGAATAMSPNGRMMMHVMLVDGAYRLTYAQLDTSTSIFSVTWAREPLSSVHVQATPALLPSRELMIKGTDGLFYRKQLGSINGYSLISGL